MEMARRGKKRDRGMTREKEKERGGERKRGVGGAVGRQSVEVTGLWSRRDAVKRRGGGGETAMEENGGVAG